jgi:hypothetical protein
MQQAGTWNPVLGNPIGNIFYGKPSTPPAETDWSKFRASGANLKALAVEIVQVLG